MVNTRFALTGVLFFVLPNAWVRADAIDPQMQHDILTGWAELERIDDARTAINVTVAREEFEGPNKGSQLFTVRYRRSGDLMQISSESANKTDEIVRNQQYTFVVARESASHPWAMRFLELDLTSDAARQLRNDTFLAQICAPTSAVLLGSFFNQQRRPSSLIGDPRFKMTKAERQTDGLIQVSYEYELLLGDFYCDPTANYVIVRGHSREKGASLEYAMTHRRHFGTKDASGQANVERLVCEVIAKPGGRTTREATYSYPDVRRSGDLDEERFRLSAYGLPEPEGVVWEKPRRWLPYWLAGAGVLIVLVTTWLLRRARRARPVEARP